MIGPTAGSIEKISAATYDVFGDKLTATDLHGNITSYVYNGQGRVIETDLPLGGFTTHAIYDRVGNKLSTVTDPTGSVLAYVYDGLGREIKAADQVGHSELFFYDGDNNQVTHVDRSGTTFTTGYDNLNRVSDTKVVAPALTLSTYTYDDVNNVVVQTDADGNPTTKQYDALGRVTHVADALNHTAVSIYDGVNKTEDIDKNGNQTFYLYDAINRLKETDVKDPAGVLQTTTTTVYLDAQNQLDSQSSLIFFGARYYDPATGLFLTQDPTPIQKPNPLTLESFVYATAGTIVLSSSGAGVGWFVDPTPLDNAEFGTPLGTDAFQAAAGSAAVAHYDLLTVLLHEEGHLLGFDADIPGFTAHLGTVAGSQLFVRRAPGPYRHG